MVAFIALVVGTQMSLAKIPLGNGMVAEKAQPDYAVDLTIRKAGTTVAKLHTRKLVDEWLQSDTFWGSHVQADQMRYSDHPSPDRTECVQARIGQVLKTPDGCLVELSLVWPFTQSGHFIGNVILRWQEKKPDEWTVFDKTTVYSKGLHLFEWDQYPYVISKHTIFRLEGMNLTRKQVAVLPDAVGWVLEHQSGPRMMFTLQTNVGGNPYILVDLNTGQVRDVTIQQRADYWAQEESRQASNLGSWDHNPGLASTLPRPLLYRNTAENWNRWLTIAQDESQPGASRQIALFEFRNLVGESGHGPWTSKVISVVQRSIKDKSPRLRGSALHAARTWIWHYPQLQRHWTPKERNALRLLLDSSEFRSQVFEEAKREKIEDDQYAWMPNAFPYVNFHSALAISGHPQGFSYLVTCLKESQPYYIPVNLEPFRYYPLDKIRPIVLGVFSDFCKPNGKDLKPDAPQVIQQCINTLKLEGEHDLRIFKKLLEDKTALLELRRSICRALQYFVDDEILGVCTDIALDESADISLRFDAVTAILSSRNVSKANSVLDHLENTAKNESLTSMIRMERNSIKQIQKGRDQELSRLGFGEPERRKVGRNTPFWKKL